MPKPLRIVSWNINSVRLRAPNVEGFVAAEKPDVICLQETKCQDAEFPLKAFKDMGLGHVVMRGQRGGHAGVAIASRVPIEEVDTPELCREGAVDFRARDAAVAVGVVFDEPCLA